VSDHTRPERAAELDICRRLMAKILEDPCGHCMNREKLWGKWTCKNNPGRTWWACRDGASEPSFTLDESTIEGSAT